MHSTADEYDKLHSWGAMVDWWSIFGLRSISVVVLDQSKNLKYPHYQAQKNIDYPWTIIYTKNSQEFSSE